MTLAFGIDILVLFASLYYISKSHAPTNTKRSHSHVKPKHYTHQTSLNEAYHQPTYIYTRPLHAHPPAAASPPPALFTSPHLKHPTQYPAQYEARTCMYAIHTPQTITCAHARTVSCMIASRYRQIICVPTSQHGLIVAIVHNNDALACLRRRVCYSEEGWVGGKRRCKPHGSQNDDTASRSTFWLFWAVSRCACLVGQVL
jgi:hypothetical protein